MDQPPTDSQTPTDDQPDQPDQLAETPNEDAAGGPIGSAERYCRSCLYCLGDLTLPGAPDICPECGQGFNKLDARATLTKPRRPKSLLLRWPVLVLIGVLTAMVLTRGNLLPRPVAGGGGTLWEWRFHNYGYLDGLWWWVGDAYGTQTLERNGLELTVTLHAGIASRVLARDPGDGHLVFLVERRGDPPVWSLRIEDHELAWPHSGSTELIRAINLTREHRFGVTVYPPLDQPRRTPPGPIVASGTEADIFWAYIRAYKLSVDFPERVPRTTDGWHPTLPPGKDVVYPAPGGSIGGLRSRTIYRGR